MKTITGVPESITRAQYIELIAAAGFNPHDLVELEFRRDGIYALVFARAEDGKCIPDNDAMELVKNRVFIPIED